jgi:hypothetical protein
VAIKNVAIFCQQCKQVDIFPDYSAFFDFVNRKWDLTWQEMDDNHKFNVSSQRVVGPLNLRNLTPKQLRNILLEKEYLEYICRTCVFRVSVDWYEKNGYDIVTEGRTVICNRPYYEQHKDEVIELARRMRRQ